MPGSTGRTPSTADSWVNYASRRDRREPPVTRTDQSRDRPGLQAKARAGAGSRALLLRRPRRDRLLPRRNAHADRTPATTIEEHRHLRDLRVLVQDAARPELCRIVEGMTGRDVVASMSGFDTRADVASENFRLGPVHRTGRHRSVRLLGVCSPPPDAADHSDYGRWVRRTSIACVGALASAAARSVSLSRTNRVTRRRYTLTALGLDASGRALVPLAAREPAERDQSDQRDDHSDPDAPYDREDNAQDHEDST